MFVCVEAETLIGQFIRFQLAVGHKLHVKISQKKCIRSCKLQLSVQVLEIFVITTLIDMETEYQCYMFF